MIYDLLLFKTVLFVPYWHAHQCNHGQINWDKPEIIATFSQKNKNTLQKNLLVREKLEIKIIMQKSVAITTQKIT